VLTLAAPSLLPIFQPYTDGFSTFGFGQDGNEPYPFSVKPDRPLTVQDVMDITRDQYEGSVFDMTKGIDAGPFGDPMRYGPKFKWQDERDGVTWKQFDSGLGFQRPISLWRTSYATVTTSRKDLPDEIGALAWIAPYAPHHSSFVPVYANAEATPKSLNKGTLYYFDQGE
jgi:dipeptidase